MLSPYLTSLIERAHLLAASGRFLSVSDIRSHLHREGFTHFELTALNGKAMRKQLRKLIEETTSPQSEKDIALSGPASVAGE
jgi:hypothetical protein